MFFDQGMTTGAMECAAVSQTTLPWLKKLVREHLYASLALRGWQIQGAAVNEWLDYWIALTIYFHPAFIDDDFLLIQSHLRLPITIIRDSHFKPVVDHRGK